MSYFIFTVLDKNRKELNKLSFSEFNDNYIITTSVAQDYIDYIWELSRVRLNLEATSLELKMALKAAMAEQLYGPEEKEILLNLQDPMILKVIDIEAKKEDE